MTYAQNHTAPRHPTTRHPGQEEEPQEAPNDQDEQRSHVGPLSTSRITTMRAEPAKFEAECVLPTKRIDGPLLMRREHLTCALIELMQITHTPSRSNGVFHRPPEAFYRIEVVTAVGR